MSQWLFSMVARRQRRKHEILFWLISFIWVIKYCDFQMDVTNWYSSFMPSNFGQKSFCDFKSNLHCVLIWFWNQVYDFRPNQNYEKILQRDWLSPAWFKHWSCLIFYCSDERLTLETLAFLPFTVANLCFQLSC